MTTSELEPSFGAVYGGAVGPAASSLGANLQGRHNPKQESFRYGDSPENDPDYATDEFDNREDQTDVRDGKDYSFNAHATRSTARPPISEISGFYVRTDRTETERSLRI